MGHRHPRSAAALAAFLVLSVLASGCGGAGSTPTAVAAGASPAPTAPAPTPTGAPAGTLPPATPTAAPTPTHALASVCFGSVPDKEFFAEAASTVAFDVYCSSALPAGWLVTGKQIRGTDSVGVAYTGPGTAALKLDEGSFCTTSPALCSPHDEDLGTAMFGDLKGGVFLTNVRAAYTVYVFPGTDHSYALTGQGMDLAEFKKMAAAFVRVPRP